MKISIRIEERELELISLFKEKDFLSTQDNFENWGDTSEFKTLSQNKIIHHSNHQSTGCYIKYSLTKLGELAYEQNKERIKEFIEESKLDKNSPEYIFKAAFEKLKIKRGTPPPDWWITCNHKENIKMSKIAQVIKINPEHYKRELTYQKGLQKITSDRLKSAIKIKKGQIVKCSNNGGGYKRISHKKISDTINVEITDSKPLVSNYGKVYIHVVYKDKKVTGHFQIYENDIIK